MIRHPAQRQEVVSTNRYGTPYTGPSGRFPVLRVAAVVLLVLGAGLLVCLGLRHSPSPDPEPPVPQSEPVSADEPEESPWTELSSPLDADGDGIDDWHDMVQGARDYIATKPAYNEYGYYWGGYPDDGTGVCTDVIWQAFQAAGYDLKALIDADIEASPDQYPGMEWPEPNIDFRRVVNQDTFLARHALSLTCSLDDPNEWQPGDIVVFGLQQHIAICSDHRRIDGIPWIIHHGSEEEGAVEVNAMNRHPICGHYRWLPSPDDPLFSLPEGGQESGTEGP